MMKLEDELLEPAATLPNDDNAFVVEVMVGTAEAVTELFGMATFVVAAPVLVNTTFKPL